VSDISRDRQHERSIERRLLLAASSVEEREEVDELLLEDEGEDGLRAEPCERRPEALEEGAESLLSHDRHDALQGRRRLALAGVHDARLDDVHRLRHERRHEAGHERAHKVQRRAVGHELVGERELLGLLVGRHLTGGHQCRTHDVGADTGPERCHSLSCRPQSHIITHTTHDRETEYQAESAASSRPRAAQRTASNDRQAMERMAIVASQMRRQLRVGLHADVGDVGRRARDAAHDASEHRHADLLPPQQWRWVRCTSSSSSSMAHDPSIIQHQWIPMVGTLDQSRASTPNISLARSLERSNDEYLLRCCVPSAP